MPASTPAAQSRSKKSRDAARRRSSEQHRPSMPAGSRARMAGQQDGLKHKQQVEGMCLRIIYGDRHGDQQERHQQQPAQAREIAQGIGRRAPAHAGGKVQPAGAEERGDGKNDRQAPRHLHGRNTAEEKGQRLDRQRAEHDDGHDTEGGEEFAEENIRAAQPGEEECFERSPLLLAGDGPRGKRRGDEHTDDPLHLDQRGKQHRADQRRRMNITE